MDCKDLQVKTCPPPVWNRSQHVTAIQRSWVLLSACKLQACTAPISSPGTSPKWSAAQCRDLHTAAPLLIFRNTEFDDKLDLGVKMHSEKWNKYNTIVYPPQDKDDPVRPAVCLSL